MRGLGTGACACPPATAVSELLRAVRLARLMRGVKQSHLAELLSVTQATLSRWERGTHLPDPAHEVALRRWLDTAGNSGADAALKRLVESSAQPVHLIRDGTHQLLAASAPREAAWRATANDLQGQSMWRFASSEIEAVEARLGEIGWFDGISAIAFQTGGNTDPLVPIMPGRVLWERIRLQDGTEARLVTTLADDGPLPAGVRGV